MSWLIDTNLISLCHKRHLPARLADWLAKNEAECFISAITIAEMRFGVELADESLRDVLAARVDQTESDFAEAIESVDTETLLHWKRVFAFLKSIRRTLPCEDTLLAAQCLAKGHVLATDNTKHFALLRSLGLKTENPLVG
jgi:predicted nucleic acid-binding protein